MGERMAEHITIGRCISEILMCRKMEPNVLFLFVEGTDDVKLFSRFIDSDVKIRLCEGKPNVCRLMKTVEQRRIKNVVAIVDKDYDSILNSKPMITGVFFTDGTDIESSILKVDGIIQKFLLEYSDFNKVESYNVEHVPELIQKVFDICSQVGKIRLANQKYDIGMRFDGVKIADFINEDMNFSIGEYQDAVIDNSDIKSSKESIRDRVSWELSDTFEFWEICRGHDLLDVMQYVFSSKKGCLRYGDIPFSSSELSRYIRGAYEEQWFIQTNIYRELQRWQNQKKVQLLKVG